MNKIKLLKNSSFTFKTKLKSFLILVLVFSLTISNSVVVLSNSSTERGFTKNGTVGDPLTSSEVSALDSCQDPAQLYINCNLFDPDTKIYEDVVIAVIDDGLGVFQWMVLEQYLGGSIQVDIVDYYTVNENGVEQNFGEIGVDTFGDDGLDDPQPSDDDLNWDQNDSHGYAIISVIAQITRGIKIIFIDLQLDGTTGYPSMDAVPWDNILDTWPDLSVVSYSYKGPSMKDATLKDLSHHDVFLVTSMGNTGSFQGNVPPVKEEEWYGVGSIDHETRADGSSLKHAFTGTSSDPSFESSWGWGIITEPGITDFVMPGNGIPILSDWETVVYPNPLAVPYPTWSYGAGTSLSAPYLSAAAAIAYDRFADGVSSVTGSLGAKPTISQVYDLLKSSASRSISGAGWDQKNGWGFVRLDYLSAYAYNLGVEFGNKLSMSFENEIPSTWDKAHNIWTRSSLKHDGSWSMRGTANTGTLGYDAIQTDITMSDAFVDGWVYAENYWQLLGFYLRTSTNDGVGSVTIDDGYMVRLYKNAIYMFRVTDNGLYLLDSASLGEYINYQWWHVKFQAVGDSLKAWISKTDTFPSSPTLEYDTTNDAIKYSRGKVAFSMRSQQYYRSTYWDEITVLHVDIGPTPELPEGPTDVIRYSTYSWGFNTIDPDSIALTYEIDWGDGYILQISGTTNTIVYHNHGYTSTGTFYLKVRAKTATSDWSEWSSSLQIYVSPSSGGGE